MKLKLTSLVTTSVLLLGLAGCASNVSTNAQNDDTAKQAPVAVATPAPVLPKDASELQQFLGNDKDRVYFETDSANLDDDAYQTIQTIAPILSKVPNVKYIIEGHADERGTRAYNLALGKKRANALKESLVSNSVNAGDIKTVTYGKDRPVNTAHNAQAWSENRRAVIVVKDVK